MRTGLAIQFDSVDFQVGEKSILRNLNLNIRTGETVVLLGRSGSGKTTTLKLINHLIMPTSGKVVVEGKPTLEWDPIRLRRRIGYMIQETGLFPHFTVEQNVALVPRLEDWESNRIHARVDELLQLVGLNPENYRNRYPRELSGGERQRVGVARALAADPPILLMDEPFGALDPLTRTEVQREFALLSKTLNKTIVLVTHDIREALFLATRIGLFQNGALVELLPPAELFHSKNLEAQAFIRTLQSTESQR